MDARLLEILPDDPREWEAVALEIRREAHRLRTAGFMAVEPDVREVRDRLAALLKAHPEGPTLDYGRVDPHRDLSSALASIEMALVNLELLREGL